MSDGLFIALYFVIWIALQRWILPRLGVRT
jgi:hypothetical protein